MHFVQVGEFSVPGIDNGLNDGNEVDVENDGVGNAFLAQANSLGLCQSHGSEEVLTDSGASGTYISGDALCLTLSSATTFLLILYMYRLVVAKCFVLPAVEV